MANVGDKYIIELTKRYNDRSFYAEGIDRVVTIKELDKLEKYNKEYIADCENAYDKGFRNGLEKAWEIARKYVNKTPTIEATPCTFCIYNPPSSGDGKPCTMCPAVAKGE